VHGTRMLEGFCVCCLFVLGTSTFEHNFGRLAGCLLCASPAHQFQATPNTHCRLPSPLLHHLLSDAEVVMNDVCFGHLSVVTSLVRHVTGRIVCARCLARAWVTPIHVCTHVCTHHHAQAFVCPCVFSCPQLRAGGGQTLQRVGV
jgi:hypothetical protein